jgi:hypothetical protein
MPTTIIDDLGERDFDWPKAPKEGIELRASSVQVLVVRKSFDLKDIPHHA